MISMTVSLFQTNHRVLNLNIIIVKIVEFRCALEQLRFKINKLVNILQSHD